MERFLYEKLDVSREIGATKEITNFLKQGLSKRIELREYQKEAFENFITYFENEKLINSKTKIYCIVNNGFFEGVQNHLAVSQIRCWSKKVNAQWGQGIGVGGGELLSHLKKVPLGNGPLKNLGITLEKFSKNILLLKSNEDIYINPNYPRILYFLQANISWFIVARKNKLKFRDLFKKIYNKQN